MLETFAFATLGQEAFRLFGAIAIAILANTTKNIAKMKTARTGKIGLILQVMPLRRLRTDIIEFWGESMM